MTRTKGIVCIFSMSVIVSACQLGNIDADLPQFQQQEDPILESDAVTAEPSSQIQDEENQPAPVSESLTTITDYVAQPLSKTQDATLAIDVSNTLSQTLISSQSNEENHVYATPGILVTAALSLEGADKLVHADIFNAINTSVADEWLGAIGSFSRETSLALEVSSIGQFGYLFRQDFLDQLTSRYDSSLKPALFVRDAGFYTRFDDKYYAAGSTPLYETVYDVKDKNSQRARLIHQTDSRQSFTFSEEFTLETRKIVFADLNNNLKLTDALIIQGTLGQVSNEKYTATSIPLNEPDIALLVITPETDQFDSTASAILSEIKHISENLTSTITDVSIPFFSQSSQLNSLDALFDGTSLQSQETANFTAVNDKGFLYLNQFAHNTNFTLSASGMELNSFSAARLDATDYEPASAFSPNYVNQGYSSSFSSFNYLSYDNIMPCDTAIDNRPFFYAIVNRNTQTILAIGQTVSVEGESAYIGTCPPITDTLFDLNDATNTANPDWNPTTTPAGYTTPEQP